MKAYIYPHPHAAESIEEVITLTGERMRFGRGLKNDVIIPMQNVSRVHAFIQRDPVTDCWILHDNDSSNGTFVNGSRLTLSHVLCEGDVIGFATVECVFSLVPPSDKKTLPNFRALGDDQGVLRLVSDEDESVFESGLKSAATVSKRRDMSAEHALLLAQRRLNIMYEISPILSKSTTVEQMTARILDLLFKVSKVDRASIMTCEDPSGPVNLMLVRLRNPNEMDRNVTISNHLIARCMEEKVSILGRTHLKLNAEEASRGVPADMTVVCVPLIAHLDMIGILYLETIETDGNDHCTEDDLSFFSLFGTDLALAIVNFSLSQKNLLNERLAAMGTAIAGIAHNVKNVVQLIATGMSMMDESIGKLPKNDDIVNSWSLLRRGIARMQDLCYELLSFSRQTPPKLQEMNVNKIIEDLFEAASSTMKAHRIELRKELSDNLPPHAIDAEGLTRSIANLLLNAMESMGPTGGQITARTSSFDDDSAVRIVIADTGVGIPKDKLARIWEPFFSTKSKRGTGLGLAMTRKVVEDMNGRINVSSQDGVGTTFEITLPCLRSESAEDINELPTDLNPNQTITPFNGCHSAWKQVMPEDDMDKSTSSIILPPEYRNEDDE